MNLFVRLCLVLLRAVRYRPGAFPPFGEARLGWRVLPNDLDLNLHMNNARYLSLMDLGRLDLLSRLGLLRLAFRAHWLPVLGGVTIRFFRPLRPWQRYELITRVVGWDEKWFYLEQRFESGEKLVARAIVKALMRGPDGSIPSGSLLAQLGIAQTSPPLPPEISHLPA